MRKVFLITCPGPCLKTLGKHRLLKHCYPVPQGGNGGSIKQQRQDLNVALLISCAGALPTLSDWLGLDRGREGLWRRGRTYPCISQLSATVQDTEINQLDDRKPLLGLMTLEAKAMVTGPHCSGDVVGSTLCQKMVEAVYFTAVRRRKWGQGRALPFP